MKGNDILRTIKQNGFERGATEVMLRMSEELEAIRQTQKEIGKAFDQLVRVQTMLNGALDGMQDRIEKFDFKDDDPSSTRGMV